MRFAFLVRLLMAALAAVAALSFVFQAEISAVLCPIAIVSIPLLALVLWAQRRLRQFEFPASWTNAIRVLNVATVVGWIVSLLPGLFWGALFLHILEPWPLSLQQGPDTENAVEGFSRVLGFTATENVNNIYYRGIDIRDQDRSLKFTTCDSTLTTIILEGMEQQDGGQRPPAFHLNDRLKWWFTPEEAATYEHWTTEFREVWIDRENCTYFIRSWTT